MTLSLALFALTFLPSPSAALLREDPVASKAQAPRATALFDTQADLKASIASATARAQAENRRVLVVWGKNGSDACKQLDDALKGKVLSRKMLYEYDLVRADVGESPKNVELARTFGADPKTGDAPWITILDGVGKPLANRSVPALDAQELLTFLTAQQATYLEAQKLLDASLARAAQEKKRVFLHFGAPWCGWCHKLEGWMDTPAVSTLLEKDFVLLKIDVDRTLGGKEMLEHYRGPKESGIPWFVFTNETGAAMATSEGPKGNTGFPSEAFEVEHFITMLKTARVNLSDDDLQTLRKSLETKKPEAQH